MPTGNPGQKRKPCSEKTKRNISKAKMGHFTSREARKKMSEHNNMNGKNGRKHHGWKGGVVYQQGYVFIYNSTANNRRYLAEHRLVAERYLGRRLTKDEVVHHINGIKTDNRPENLYLFSCRGDHVKADNRWWGKETLKSNLI